MDATTKERLMHAAEVLQWMANGCELEVSLSANQWRSVDNMPAHERVSLIEQGNKYRPKPAKTRRPFTEQEARRLVGCVLVSPSNLSRVVVRYVTSTSPVRHMSWEPTFAELASEGWHYHLPCDPDNLKPCWVEE